MINKKIPLFKPYLIIICSSLVLLILLISNIGYYSHDEWQKLDYILVHGIKSYIFAFGSIHVGDTFATPVRPVSFIIQGGYALFMENYPVVVHTCDVLSHAIIACLLYKVILRFGGCKKMALIASLIFVVNPLSMIAVGWSAALMDRYYVLFGLLTLLCVDSYVRLRSSSIILLLVLIFSFLSIMSKETAIILPSLVCLILFKDLNFIKSKRFWVGLIVWSIPAVTYLIYRLPALIVSFSNHVNGTYSPHLSSVVDNVILSFLYPFAINLAESGNWIFISDTYLTIYFCIHLIVLAVVGRTLGIKYVFFYLFLYFICLVPVLTLPLVAGQYLYASGLIFSVMISSLIISTCRYNFILRISSLLLVILVVLHSYYIQLNVYQRGECMNTAMVSMESVYLSSSRPTQVFFKADPGAPLWIIDSIITGRGRIGVYDNLSLKSLQSDAIVSPNNLVIWMNKDCIEYAK
mgnify:CR=1 FL=1|tara:strand:- start:928 stop:2319 length:1392 start_codon:yes stop_codon:yes gene_type:complete